MSRYGKGKIYKITSEYTRKCYIGSTIIPLKYRFGQHKYNFMNPDSRTCSSSKRILRYDDSIIELIEKYPCRSSNELQDRERYWIEEYGNDCVNILMPRRTAKERYAKNINGARDKKKEQSRKYRRKNSKKIITCDCGSVFNKNGKFSHTKTKKHREYVESLEDD